jgi:hypothetical protein
MEDFYSDGLNVGYGRSRLNSGHGLPQSNGDRDSDEEQLMNSN